MLKVFLIEDEIIMREGIKNHISWKANDLELVGEASDGELAYPMIKSLNPDIIITDIMMPFMNGLELSRLLKSEMPQVKIIILSGYDEFKFAKEAISIGVTEYLVKPISSEKLLEVINKVADQIITEREQQNKLQLKQDILEYENLIRTKFFEKIISNSLGVTEILKQGFELGLEMSAAMYHLILIQFNQYDQPLAGYEEEMLSATKKIKSVFSNAKDSYLFDRGIEGIAFILKGNSKDEIIKTKNNVVDQLKTILKDYSSISFFGGIGSLVHRLSEISKSFYQANRALSYRYVMEQNQFLSSDQITDSYSKNEKEKINIKEFGKFDKEAIDNFLKSGHLSEASAFLEDYLSSLGEVNINSYLCRQYVVMDMYVTIIAFLTKLGQDTTEVLKLCGEYEQITEQINTIERMKEYLEGIIVKAITIRNKISTKKNEKILVKAKKYIMEHYDQDDISLNSVASFVNLSPSHFSMIFSQGVGETFIEFLTNARIEKAKELLLCTNMKTYEVGVAVGYKDSHYFSYLFKKFTKYTPTEFRSLSK